uniref:macro domain-containing protein n=1 Tax=Segatella hominis TaxID=2518605 RepID=UPI004028B1B0
MHILKVLWDLIKRSQKIAVWVLSVVSVVFTFVPESVFATIKKWSFISQYIVGLLGDNLSIENINIIFNRLLLFATVWGIFTVVKIVKLYFIKSVTIKGNDFIVEVKYGDILKEVDCRRVIAFDECFTTVVGNAPNEIKPSSICGQYLQSNPGIDIPELISSIHLTPDRRKSLYRHNIRYKSGTIVPNGNDLLLAFAPLDETGRGVFPSYKEYLDSLFYLWKELDKYYAQQDVSISILGSGITRIGDGMGSFISQQELLDMIIESYKLSPYKIKKPHTLRIICRKDNDFSLNKM